MIIPDRDIIMLRSVQLFGEIDDAIMRLNDAGQMIDQEWNQIPKRYGCVILDKYVIMPDHFHGIVQIISDKNGGNTSSEHAGTSLVDVLNDADDINIYPCETGESTTDGTGTRPVPTLFEIIGAFKSITTNRYINCVKQDNWPRFKKRLWQLRYNDRVIRDDGELDRIRKYIIENPLNWERDEDNPWNCG
jgi:REP element-mobilizing transposase RayT